MDIPSFQKKVLTFYKKNGRTLPWRATQNPYKILVSEIMLQQTQVDRVVPFYTTWIQTWPTIQSLARASARDVLRKWMGLGYNNRALNLLKTAHIIAREFDGDVLTAMQHHSRLPGIGPYTASAVQIFSANADLVTVDTNIRRLLIHEFSLTKPTDQELWKLADACLPRGQSRDWHNALMDYGQVLTSRRTGIRPKTQQSAFEGSDRQLRARILRLLLDKPVTLAALTKTLDTEGKRLGRILAGMQRDGIIQGKKRISLRT